MKDEETTLRHHTMTDYEDQIAAVDRFEEYFLNSKRRHCADEVAGLAQCEPMGKD